MHADVFRRAPEVEAPEDAATEQLRRCLRRHVVDVRPTWEGSEAARGAVSGALIGVVEGSVKRCDPALTIARVAIEGGKSTVLVGPNGAGKSTLFDAFMERDGAVFSGGSHGFAKGVHGKETLRIARLDQEDC
ncbi:ATP-binding cassette domain-containing protein [Candidatus Uhrbacteria bacterium]|nr:ATP-binding cassette domain-containing protein [Candidatus Uhrbacteria bacterium]